MESGVSKKNVLGGLSGQIMVGTVMRVYFELRGGGSIRVHKGQTCKKARPGDHWSWIYFHVAEG